MSTVIDAPIDAVWSILGDFGALASYYAAVDKLNLSPGSHGKQVGCVRNFTLKSGVTLGERLVALSDVDHAGSYEVIFEDMAFRNVLCHYQLHPITDEDKTLISWLTTFDGPADGSEIGFMQFLEHDVYDQCFAGLKKLVA